MAFLSLEEKIIIRMHMITSAPSIVIIKLIRDFDINAVEAVDCKIISLNPPADNFSGKNRKSNAEEIK